VKFPGARVFVTQADPTKNIRPARTYGEIITVLPHDAGFHLPSLIPTIHERLQSITTDDYLLLIGDPLTIGAVVAVASYYTQGQLKLLKWDRQEKGYFDVSINLNDGGKL